MKYVFWFFIIVLLFISVGGVKLYEKHVGHSLTYKESCVIFVVIGLLTCLIIWAWFGFKIPMG